LVLACKRQFAPDHQEVLCVLHFLRRPSRGLGSPQPALLPRRWDLESTSARPATMTTMSMRRRSIAAHAATDTPAAMSTTADPMSSCARPAGAAAAANISIGTARPVLMPAAIHRICTELLQQRARAAPGSSAVFDDGDVGRLFVLHALHVIARIHVMHFPRDAAGEIRQQIKTRCPHLLDGDGAA